MQKNRTEADAAGRDTDNRKKKIEKKRAADLKTCVSLANHNLKSAEGEI